jgi:hypothetical protein
LLVLTDFTQAFALSLSIPRQEVSSLTVTDGCTEVMTAAGQTDANDCITVQFVLAADHEVAVSLLQTATYPDALAALLRAQSAACKISTGGADAAAAGASRKVDVSSAPAWGQMDQSVEVSDVKLEPEPQPDDVKSHQRSSRCLR